MRRPRRYSATTMRRDTTKSAGARTQFTVPAVEMPAETSAKFEKQVLELFHAGWDTAKISRWAGSAASGFGSYFTAEEALPVIYAICKAENDAVRKVYRSAMNQTIDGLRKDFPEFAHYFRRA